MQPTEISVAPDRAALAITWPDGAHQTLSAPTLRQMSRSALSESTRLKGWDVPADGGLTITAVEAVGVYAINITFSDGYAKGIYPWDMLRSSHDAPPVPGRTTDQADAISELGN